MGDEEVDFLLADKHKSFLQDGSIIFSVISQTGTQSMKNNHLTISLQYLKENMNDEVDFCLLENVKGFFKLLLSF